MKVILDKLQGDKVIWLVVVLLALFSILAVYSSTGTLAYRHQSGNTEYYVLRHLFVLLSGLGLMFIAHKIKYTYYSRLAQLALYITIPMLLLTLIIGVNLNDATRWIMLPVINISFQTSDLAKLALIMYIARLLAKNQDKIDDFKSVFLPAIIPVLIVCGLIFFANLSTAMLLFATSVVVLFIGRIKIKYILSVLAVGVLFFGIFIGILFVAPDSGRLQTWKNRIENFTNPESADTFQSDQAKIAIATGGITGKMPGNSVQRNFLPHAYSDFIYAIIVEEYGLIGGFVLLLLYLILMFRGIRIAHRSPGTFGAFLAAGLTFSLVFQAMINMAVTVGLLPVTGLPLPLISMGGTSVWFTCISLGIILSVSRKVEELKEQEATTYATV